MSQQSTTPKFERYVPPEILTFLQELRESNGWTKSKPYNDALRKLDPSIPRSTVTRWTRAFLTDEAHTETPSWHRRYRSDSSLVPDHFSALKSGEFDESLQRISASGEFRYLNWSCWHRPVGDGALISVALQIAHDFRPNIVPMMSDFLHMDRFKPHAAKPHDAGTQIHDETLYKPNRNKYIELNTLTTECIDMVRSAVGDDALLLNLWGNHENWIMRHLLDIAAVAGDADIVEKIAEDYFSLLQSKGVLWVEMDSHRYLPLSQHFWIGHGHLSGKNVAQKYHNKLNSAVSLAIGHVHSEDVMWVRTPRDEHFVAVAPTLGVLTNGYNHHDFTAHNWGLQLITHPTEGWMGATVETVRIQYRNGYYVARWRDKEYSEKATFEYHPVRDMMTIGVA